MHHEDFLHIFEDKILTLDEQCKVTDERQENSDNKSPLRDAELIHENPYGMEVRWNNSNDTVTTMMLLKKDGLIWRTIIGTEPKTHTL